MEHWRPEAVGRRSERNVSRRIVAEFALPGDFGRLSRPAALDSRLRELLNRQDRDGRLSAGEQREAQALTDLADLLCLLRLRAR